jgi:hypothetical protein
LFINEQGEIVSVDRFKGLFVAVALVMIVMLAIIICFYFLYKGKIKENDSLKKALKTSKQKITVLREEKDVLMVRFVLAESKLRNGKLGTQEKSVEKSIKNLDDESGSTEANTSAENEEKAFGRAENNLIIKQTAAYSESTGSTDRRVKPEKLQVVDIEDLTVLHETDKKELIIKFILRKIAQNSKTVSGRAFVVLKRDNVDQDQWLALPSVPLISGKPSQVKRGQYFSIANFKWIKFERKSQAVTKRFQSVTVFIFATTGELLLEKELAI